MVGTPALQVAQKVGVMNDAGEVGVLVIDAEGEEVPAIVNLTIEGNALRTFHRVVHFRTESFAALSHPGRRSYSAQKHFCLW